MQFLQVLWIPALTGASLALSVLWLGPSSALFALLLNAFVLSEVAGFAEVGSVRLPEPYYRLRRIERGGDIYRFAGVRFFKRLMTSKAYRRISPPFTLERRNPFAALGRMQSAEGAHLIAFVLVLASAFVVLALGSVRGALWLSIFNLVGNGYPVMLQRYNRGRLARIIGAR